MMHRGAVVGQDHHCGSIITIAGSHPGSDNVRLPTMCERICRLIGIDLRGLALFRAGLGCVLLADLAVRCRDLVAHYTDAGCVPREVVETYYAGTWRWSLHLLSGEPGFIAGLFAVAAVAAGCLLVGWHTRLATITAWVLWASLGTRNPPVLNAGDTLLLLLLFWSMFLPLGQVWSVDAWRRRKHAADSPTANRSLGGERICSLASAAILIQVAIVYLMTGLYKFNADWLQGDALYYAFSFDAYARPAAAWLLDYPGVCQVLSHVTLWSELLVPLIVFCPIGTRLLRSIACVWFVGLHLGIELTLTVGLFSWVSIVAWLLFLPWPGGASNRTEPAATARAIRRLRPASWFVGGALTFVLLWNAAGLVVSKTSWFPRDTCWRQMADVVRSKPMRRFADLTLLYQKWNMFSRPARDDAWLAAIATNRDGHRFDLLNASGVVDFAKPELLIDRQANHRWRKYQRRLTEPKAQGLPSTLLPLSGRVFPDPRARSDNDRSRRSAGADRTDGSAWRATAIPPAPALPRRIGTRGSLPGSTPARHRAGQTPAGNLTAHLSVRARRGIGLHPAAPRRPPRQSTSSPTRKTIGCRHTGSAASRPSRPA